MGFSTFFKSLAWGLLHLRTRPGQALGQALLVAVGLGAAMGVERLHRASDQALVDELEGIDLVLSAVGSPTQALLASVFHLDNPVGNIDTAWANRWMKHPDIAQAFPLAYGDESKGVRILGCTPAFYDWKKMDLQEGRLPAKPFEVIAGVDAASKLDLKLGDTFYGSHGAEGDLGDHTDHPYQVVGIGDARGKAVDGLLLTPLETVWAVHPDAPADYTAVLLRTQSPMAALFLPRSIRSDGKGMAVSPPLEINRLRSLLDQGNRLFSGMSTLMTALALFAMVLMWWNFALERRAELALLRANGANGIQIYGFIAGPFFFVLGLGWALGWLAQGIWSLPGWPVTLPLFQWIPLDFYLLGWGGLAAALLALLPTWRALTTSIHTALLDA